MSLELPFKPQDRIQVVSLDNSMRERYIGTGVRIGDRGTILRVDLDKYEARVSLDKMYMCTLDLNDIQHTGYLPDETFDDLSEYERSLARRFIEKYRKLRMDNSMMMSNMFSLPFRRGDYVTIMKVDISGIPKYKWDMMSTSVSPSLIGKVLDYDTYRRVYGVRTMDQSRIELTEDEMVLYTGPWTSIPKNVEGFDPNVVDYIPGFRI